MRDELLALLKQLNPENDYEHCDDFMRDELLDSFEIISLIEAVEERYGIEIDGEDIVADNFVNLGSIEKMIRKYL